MENLTEAQQQRALKNFVYRQNYYNKYQKENRDKFVQSSKKYFDGLMNDEEKKAEYKQKKKTTINGLEKNAIKNEWKRRRGLRMKRSKINNFLNLGLSHFTQNDINFNYIKDIHKLNVNLV